MSLRKKILFWAILVLVSGGGFWGCPFGYPL
jgi:hypothetical protein